MKILHIVGARPHFMKLFPLKRSLDRLGIESKILHTGQHYDKNMSDIFFLEMNMKEPEYNLKIKSSKISRLIEGIENTLLKEKFDSVFLYGDTSSTLAGAIAGRQLGLKVIHYEAGVRNFDPTMPEEINRILVDRISDINFCVTQKCLDNILKEERWYSSSYYLTGDLMYDSYKMFQNTDQSPLPEKEYVYVTVHRASNTDNIENLSNIINFLNFLSQKTHIVFPMHPRTRKAISKNNIKLKFNPIDPVSYFRSINLIKNSEYVITDSGGIVRESYWSKKPSVLLLENPLWPEISDRNASINCKSTFEDIKYSVSMLKDLSPEFDENLYGNGNTSYLIATILNEQESVQ